MQNIMTPEHPDWREFIYLLEVAVEGQGCIGDGVQVDPATGRQVRLHQAHHAHAMRVLAQTWPDVDVEESISFFQQNGGYCDCEVLLNVDR